MVKSLLVVLLLAGAPDAEECAEKRAELALEEKGLTTLRQLHSTLVESRKVATPKNGVRSRAREVLDEGIDAMEDCMDRAKEEITRLREELTACR